MKTLSLLIVLASLASAPAHAEESLLIPTLASEWAPAAKTAEPAAAGAPLIEAEPGHFYRFSATKGATRVYHSTDPKDFGSEGKYPEAMHFVASLPVAVDSVVKRDDQWYLVAGQREARLTWKPLAQAVPNLRHGASDKIRVALYDDSGSMGKGVPNCLAQLSATPGMQVTNLTGDGIRAGLSGYDVVIFSGGSGSKQASTIGLSGREQVRRFVDAGGGYVGICAGAYLACEGFKWGVGVLNAKTPSSLWERGHADLKIEATPVGQGLLKLPAQATVLYHNGPILTPGLNPGIPAYEPLVFFRTEVTKTPKQAGLQINTPAMARGSYGKGHVLVSSPHPEQTPGMEHWIEHAVRAVVAATP